MAMRLMTAFQPKTILSREEVMRGLRALTWEGIASTGFSSLTTSTFLVAFALALGADNFQIGVLASLPFITDLLQLPAVWLIEKVRRRKAIVLFPWLVSQLLWIPIAFIPVVMNIPGKEAISMLLGLIAVRGVLNSLANCGWSSWMRDLVPQHILGRYFARRESLATAFAVVLGLSAGYFLDRWGLGQNEAIGYSLVFVIGLVFFGLSSPALMAFIPEPMMPPVTCTRSSFSTTLATPLREKNYRHFMKFLLFWGFAANIAVPFFAVFMLQQLKLSVFAVITLTLVSEVFTVISLRFWGPLADKLGSRVVLYISAFLFLLVLGGWTIIAALGHHTFIIPILVILHIFIGISAAGITLTIGTLSFKLAPYGRATPFLAGASLADSVGTGIGALAGGLLADLLNGYQILFAMSLLTGLMTIRTLHAINETGATRREAVISSLIAGIYRRFDWLDHVLDKVYQGVFISNFFRIVPPANGVADNTFNCFGNAEGTAAQMTNTALRELERKPPPWRIQGVMFSILDDTYDAVCQND
jgi:MFS family permease